MTSKTIYTPPPLEGLFDVQLSDPPWWYNNRRAGGERKKPKFGGGAMKHYPLMRDKELLAMADLIKQHTPENAVHFMWTTMPRLKFGIKLIEAWGFEYITAAFSWVKVTKKGQAFPHKFIYGGGSYTGSNLEICIIGVKGKWMTPTGRKLAPSVILAPRGEHSEKPPEAVDLIDQMYPTPKHRKVEFFCRTPRQGWTAWGNQIAPDPIVWTPGGIRV